MSNVWQMLDVEEVLRIGGLGWASVHLWERAINQFIFEALDEASPRCVSRHDNYSLSLQSPRPTLPV